MQILTLTGREIKVLNHCETIIERGKNTFLKVGKALLAIRQQKLYRAEYPSFDAYCRGRWKFGGSRARQLIAAAKTAESVDTSTVLNERQAKELTRVPSDHRQDVLDRAQAKVNGKPLTAVGNGQEGKTPCE